MPVPGSPPRLQAIKVLERMFRERARSPGPELCNTLNIDMVKLWLWEISGGQQQLEELEQLALLTGEEKEQRSNICRNIQEGFIRAEYKDCKVYPFGSSVNR